MNKEKRARDMRMIQKIVAGCIGLCLFACTETDELKTTAGKTGFVVSLTDGSVGVESRKTPAELNVPKTEFTIKVWKAGSDELVASAPCTGETGQVIEVGTGVYDVTAEAGENPLIALDAPYYKGFTEDQRVDADKTTNVSIACKVANSLVSVKYDEENLKFSDIYQDGYYVRVVAGGDSEDIKNVENSVYFRAGSVFEVYFCGMKIGETEEKQVKLDVGRTTLQAGDHLILTLSPEPDKYELPLSITKVEVKQETINATIPMEWLPKPKIGYFNEKEGVTSIEHTESNNATPAKLNFSGSMAIEDIELGFEFGDKQYADWNSKTYNLATISDEDKSALTQVGIVLPELGKSTMGSIDFTNLTANLQVAEGSVTENKIKLRVKANNRWSSEEDNPSVYIIKTIAPKITVLAKPEDIWAKSLTVSSSEVESDNPTKITVTGYQYLDGAEWKDCTDGLAKLTDLPVEPKMQVRAVYREGVYAEPMEIELETPTQLPNSGMEEWNTETYKDGEFYSFNPWDSNETPFWDTNNDFTTRHRHNVSIIDNYNGFHAVSYVQGRGKNGLAAELRNTANGRANTEYFPIFSQRKEHDYNKVAGRLFTGVAKVTTGWNDADAKGDTYEEEKNASFPSRPTALQFYYKYVPYGSDTWSVHIELLDENKNIIIQNEKTSSETMNDWSAEPFRVELNYLDGTMYAKCKYVYVMFKSTINEGANMPYREITQTFYVLENGALSAKTYSQAYVGSILTIDDISLIYDK